MPKKHAFEEVKRIVEERGYIMLQDYYVNNRIKILIGNDFGYKALTTLDSLVSNRQVTWVFKNNPYSIENIQLFLDSKNEGTIILEKEYKHQKQKLKLQCSCGEIFYKTWADLLHETHTKCNKCIAEERGFNRRLLMEDLQKAADKIGLTILTTEYTSYDGRLECIDSEGYRGTTSAHSIQAGRSFARFNRRNNAEYYLYNVNHRAQLVGQNIKVLSVREKDRWNTPTFYCKCLLCGEEFECSAATFFAGKMACDTCTDLFSHYSVVVANWLENNGYHYIREKRFKDCVYKAQLPFDFYLKKYNLLIEVDGEGHFGPVCFKGISEERALEGFKLTQIRDSVKNKYAKENFFNLIRIPYWDIKSGEYQNILANFFAQYH